MLHLNNELKKRTQWRRLNKRVHDRERSDQSLGRGCTRKLPEAMVNSLGWDWLRSWMPPECMELCARRFNIKRGQSLALGLFSLRMPGWSCCSCLCPKGQHFGQEKKPWAQPRIRLAWQRVAGLFFFGCLTGMGSKAKPASLPKIIKN